MMQCIVNKLHTASFKHLQLNKKRHLPLYCHHLSINFLDLSYLFKFKFCFSFSTVER